MCSVLGEIANVADANLTQTQPIITNKDTTLRKKNSPLLNLDRNGDTHLTTNKT